MRSTTWSSAWHREFGGRGGRGRGALIKAACAAVAAWTFPSVANATTISIPSPNYLPLNSVPTMGTAAGSVGSDGFEFFNFGQSGTSADNTLSPISYATIGITAGEGYAGSTSYSQLTINGTKKYTGVVDGGANVISTTFVTITLSSTASLVPQEFQLGLLGDTTAGTGNDTEYTVADTTAGVSITITNSYAYYATNDFYFVDITGASPGDTIVISGVASKTTASLGGITFDTLEAPVPEPTTLTLAGIGVVSLLSRPRRRPA